jgi:AI-2 transport protein TqsA
MQRRRGAAWAGARAGVEAEGRAVEQRREMVEPVPPAVRGKDPRGFERLCLGIIVAAIVLVILVQAKFFLIPLAIAALLFSLIGAAIDRIMSVRIAGFAVPHWLASLLAVSAIGFVMMELFGFVASQVDVVLATLPIYIERGQIAIARLFSLVGDDVARGVLDGFRDINLNAYLRMAAGSAGSLLAVGVMLIVYVGFLFGERVHFETKLGKLFPQPERATHVRTVLLSIRRSVHHYVLVKTAVSAVTGLVIYGVARLFKLDFAELIAILTFLLNFIPTLGSIVATALPVLVALVQFDALLPVLGVLAAAGTVQFVLGNILDPMLMGRTLQMSSFAIILSLTVWSAIWGVPGMFLAVPLTAMAMIVCAHIEALRPIAIVLSRDGEPLFGQDEAAGETA